MEIIQKIEINQKWGFLDWEQWKDSISDDTGADQVIVLNYYNKNGTEIMGDLISYPPQGDTLHLFKVDVNEDERQKGVATALLKHLLKKTLRRKEFRHIKWATLEVDGGRDNRGAKRLYENEGFHWQSDASDRMYKQIRQ